VQVSYERGIPANEGEKLYNETYLRLQIVEAGKKLAQRFFVASNDGNISARVGNNAILITPTGINKGDVLPDQIIKIDMDGNVIEGHMKVSSEFKMHLAVYKMRPDVKAIVHAHPPAATAFAVSGEKLDDPLILPEALFGLGKIGYCEYGTPSTNEVSLSVEKEVLYSDTFLLANHGALTLGDDVMQAYYRMENLEMVSRITLATKIIGKVRALDEQSIVKLNRVKEEQGWGKIRSRSADTETRVNKVSNLDVDKITKMILDAINENNG
jgi:L-fuculose-phosphate aldolase